MGNSFIALSMSGENLNIVVGMPAVYASEGRLERFLDLLQEEFGGSVQDAKRVSELSACLQN
jgi:hypothetical protein